MSIDYERICREAKFRASGYRNVDWRDFAQESVLRQLMGRKSVTGPMQDLARQRGSRCKERKTLVWLRPNLAAENTAAPVIMTRLARAIDSLPNRCASVLRNIYWEGMDPLEIALKLGTSPARVRQIHGRALQKIRDSIR